jgi:hypothetical protein
VCAAILLGADGSSQQLSSPLAAGLASDLDSAVLERTPLFCLFFVCCVLLRTTNHLLHFLQTVIGTRALHAFKRATFGLP